MTILSKVAAGACALALSAGVAAATPVLVFSDDFESPENTSNWQVYSEFNGWEAAEGTAGIEVQTTGTVSGVSAQSGNQYVELDSDTSRGGASGAPTNSAMSRVLALTAGVYDLVWWYLPRTSTENDNLIEVFLDAAGSTLFTNLIGSEDGRRPPITDWIQVTNRFSVETAGDYALSFRAGGIENTLGGFVDTVSVSRIPLPAPALMLLLGVGALGGIRWSRRNRGAVGA